MTSPYLTHLDALRGARATLERLRDNAAAAPLRERYAAQKAAVDEEIARHMHADFEREQAREAKRQERAVEREEIKAQVDREIDEALERLGAPKRPPSARAKPRLRVVK